MKPFSFKLLFSLLFALIIVLLTIYVYQINYIKSKSGNHIIIFSSDGFIPNKLTISKGQTVTFINNNNIQVWPASDAHPTHSIYPEFDPLQPIDPGQSWGFTFNDTGTFPFHDHLNSLETGVIIVGRQTSTKVDCSNSDNQIICWHNQVKGTLKTQGLGAAFDLLGELYTAQPAFAAQCHGFTHTLGQAAYEMFASDQNFELSAKTAYCGYGFYHGFMETLLITTNDLNQAQAFCANVGRKLANETSDGEGACYHGIGHGAVDGSDQRSLGNPQAMINPGLKLCEFASSDNQQFLTRCASGVFNSLAIMYSDPKYKLEINKKDVFQICSKQSGDAFKHACYAEMNTLVMALGDNDFNKASIFLKQITEKKYAPSATESLANAAMKSISIKNADNGDIIKSCRLLENELQTSCIRGFAAGFIEFGAPQTEYIAALNFCNSSFLSEEERKSCFNRVFWLTSVYYPQAKQQTVCSQVEEKYHAFCAI